MGAGKPFFMQLGSAQILCRTLYFYSAINMPNSDSLRKQIGAEVYHRGSHPQYSDYVNSRVNKIRSRWKPGINDSATIKKIEKLQVKLKGKIKSGEVPRGKVSCRKIG